MDLAPETRLGPYDVVGLIGAGPATRVRRRR
jgi:hypothetical protein